MDSKTEAGLRQTGEEEKKEANQPFTRATRQRKSGKPQSLQIRWSIAQGKKKHKSQSDQGGRK